MVVTCCTLWSFNIDIEHGTFIVDLPITCCNSTIMSHTYSWDSKSRCEPKDHTGGHTLSCPNTYLKKIKNNNDNDKNKNNNNNKNNNKNNNNNNNDNNKDNNNNQKHNNKNKNNNRATRTTTRTTRTTTRTTTTTTTAITTTLVRSNSSYMVKPVYLDTETTSHQI
jgi:telomerase reverse transcriptase